jgi:hypothetical protein
MKKVFPALLFLLSTSIAFAYNPIVVKPPQPYDVIPVEGDPYIEHQFLGILEDYPEMFEIKTESSIDLKISLRQLDTDKAVPFGLIMVRQNDGDGGVSEVLRQNEAVADWKKVKDSILGINFLEGTAIQKSVSPGTYRVEVSTPDNKGAYMLVVGEEPQSNGFFKALAQIYTTQRHFGYTPLHLLFSSYIYYPLGILLVLYGIYRTWRYRKELAHVS